MKYQIPSIKRIAIKKDKEHEDKIDITFDFASYALTEEDEIIKD